MPNAAAKAMTKKDKETGAPTAKAFGLLMGKRVVVTLKPESDDDKPQSYEGVLRSFDDTRIILEDNFEYEPIEIDSIGTCNIKK